MLSDANVPVHFRANSIAAQMCLWHYIKLIWESPTIEDKNLYRHLRSFQFIQNSNQMASRLMATTSSLRVRFQVLQFSRQRQSFSAHRAASMTKTDLIFPTFSLRFVDFAVQFYFCCKFSFHEKRRSSQVWQWRDFSWPITILCYA